MNQDIKSICQLNENWTPQNIKIKRAGGQTNRNWVVEYKNKKFFVRFPWQRTDIINRKAEAKNILTIVKSRRLAGIVPKYLLYIFKKKNIISSSAGIDLPDGTSIMEYIEGKDINGKDLEKIKNQQSLLKTLRTFHNSGVKFTNNYDVFRDELEKYRKKAKQYPITNLISQKRIQNIENVEIIAKKNFPLGGRVSTHNDLIFENLRLGENGKVYLLDFEYAGFNIRNGLYYDLGIILGGNLFQENPLKIKTFEKIIKEAEKVYKWKLNKKKLYFGALINVLVMFWWGVVKYFSSKAKKEKQYFREYVFKRSKGVEILYDFIQKPKALS